MSVLIKDMDMPRDCKHCRIALYDEVYGTICPITQEYTCCELSESKLACGADMRGERDAYTCKKSASKDYKKGFRDRLNKIPLD